MSQRSALINVMTAAARKASRRLVRDFGEVENLQVSRKGPADFVSIADRRAERTLGEELRKARPNFTLVMEESGTDHGSDPDHRWLVDPLDGTLNFLNGIPHFAISIALEFRGEIIAAVVYQPARDELYWAERGFGAFIDSRRLRVSARDDLVDAVIGTGHTPASPEATVRHLRELDTLVPAVAAVRNHGAASLDLAYVAAGRFDAYWEVGLKPWDIAAGLLLVREAGGLICNTRGRDISLEDGDMLASNPRLQGKILRLLAQANRPALVDVANAP